MEAQFYKKVYIKSKKDLPKEGCYFACSHEALIRPTEYNNGNKSFWLKYIDWYLQPLGQSSISAEAVLDSKVTISVKNNDNPTLMGLTELKKLILQAMEEYANLRIIETLKNKE